MSRVPSVNATSCPVRDLTAAASMAELARTAPAGIVCHRNKVGAESGLCHCRRVSGTRRGEVADKGSTPGDFEAVANDFSQGRSPSN